MNNLNSVELTNLSSTIEGNTKSSNHEVIRVFDEKFNYVNNTTRLLCHRLGLYHEVVNCFIIDENFNVLLQNRKDKIIETYDLSVGGHINLDDIIPESALKRECKEELNLEIDIDKLSKITTYKRFGYTNILKPRETNNEFRHLFCYFINNDEKQKLFDNFDNRENSEAECFLWKNIEDTINLISQGMAFDGLQFSMYYLLSWLKERKNG